MGCHPESKAWAGRAALAAVFALLAATPPAGAQPEALPLFTSPEPLQVEIQTDYFRLLRDRGEDAGEHPATLRYRDAAGEWVDIALDISTRGGNRNRENVCRFPPLRLDFPRDELQGTVFAGQNRLKLVSHCRPRSRYDQYLLLEYLNYRLLNLLTPNSLQVRLLDVVYRNASGGVHTEARAFLIEDLSRMGERTGLREAELSRVRRQWYEPAQHTLVAVFQYLIGNTDWSALIGPDGEACCHNVYPMQRGDGFFIPVPFDFDLSGTVNPHYGNPPRQLSIRRFTQRVWRGGCPEPEQLRAALQTLVDTKARIMRLYETQAGLQPMTLRRTLTFLEAFYEILADPEQVRAAFQAECG